MNKRLLEDEPRCTGRYDFSTYDLCPDRGYCLRFTQLLRERWEGVCHDPETPIIMAQEHCEMYVDKDFEGVI